MEGAVGSVVEGAVGSLVEGAVGSVVDGAVGSLVEDAVGSVVEGAEDPVVEGSTVDDVVGESLGSLVDDADGSLVDDDCPGVEPSEGCVVVGADDSDELDGLPVEAIVPGVDGGVVFAESSAFGDDVAGGSATTTGGFEASEPVGATLGTEGAALDGAAGFVGSECTTVVVPFEMMTTGTFGGTGRGTSTEPSPGVVTLDP